MWFQADGSRVRKVDIVLSIMQKRCGSSSIEQSSHDNEAEGDGILQQQFQMQMQQAVFLDSSF